MVTRRDFTWLEAKRRAGEELHSFSHYFQSAQREGGNQMIDQPRVPKKRNTSWVHSENQFAKNWHKYTP